MPKGVKLKLSAKTEVVWSHAAEVHPLFVPVFTPFDKLVMVGLQLIALVGGTSPVVTEPVKQDGKLGLVTPP